MKRFLCVLITIILLIIPLAVFPVSADDTATSELNNWTVQNWKDFFGEDFDPAEDLAGYEKYMEDYFKSNGYTVNDSLIVGSNLDDTGKPQVLNLYVTDGKYNVNSDNQYGSTRYSFAAEDSTYSSCLVIWYYGTIKLISEASSSNNTFLVYDDVSLNSSDAYFYYSADPYQTFLDYLRGSQYDDMFYDVYPVADGCKNIIRFYDCFDSYYGKYQYDFYEDNMLNYLNSSFSINSPIYFQPKGIDTAHQLDGADLQHNEMYYIYVPVPNDFSIEQTNEYLTNIGSAVHYEKGSIDFGTWYDTYIKPWLSRFSANSEYKLVTLKNVEPSTSENPTVNTTDEKQDINLLRLTFPSAYTFLESSEDDGGFIMTGCRTMSTGQKVDLSNGTIDNSAKDGIGSNIDGGDYLDDKERDDLLADGWKNGYPNKSSFPYKITINKNGYVLYEIFFDKKPSIEANFYSDSQIAYDIDFNLTRGYFYAKQQNCYIDFNFRNDNEDDYLTSDGTLTDSVTDEIKKSMANKFAQIVDCFINGVGYFTQEDYEYVNYEKYLTEKIIRIWTNYTGQLTGTYRGYYVQFNWDLEEDEDFVKNNSDDNHNYSDDYLADEGFTDNNGNIHGGAVDPPTESPNYNGFNNEDFSFDENNLWKYADSFLGFCYRAFRVLPEFLWHLIGCGVVIIIILRILSR